MLGRICSFTFVILIFVVISCQRDGYYEGNDVQLTFSNDTLRFDTVFTSLGSSTRFIKIFNPKSEPILINVTLKNQNNSFSESMQMV
ncbi:MAG: hypothetical protein IPO92_23495 [Saprospiraceae bacterium]|nr:hypothetical protein [Saprospiraceae bacterium]